MELEPEQTPDRYVSIRCEEVLDNGIKVIRNITESREIFYHVAKYPPVEELTCGDDIEVLAAFQVYPDERPWDVFQNALERAKDYV